MQFLHAFSWGLIALVLSGCAGVLTRSGDEAPGTSVCPLPQTNAVVASAEWYSGQSHALGTLDRMRSAVKLRGQLVISESGICFSPQGEIKGRSDPGIQVHSFTQVEIAYREGDWLFIRGYPNESGLRQFQGFRIRDGDEIAALALAEVRRHVPIEVVPAGVLAPASRVVTVLGGGPPRIQIAVADREGFGATVVSATGSTFLDALLGPGGLGPYVLVPPVAAAVIAGGAVAGAAKAEAEAQRAAHVFVVVDGILVSAVQDMDLAARIVRGIEKALGPIPDWDVVPAGGTPSVHGFHYQGAALNGIHCVVEVAPLQIELRTDGKDAERSGEQAGYALSITQPIAIYSTLTGEPMDSLAVRVSAGSRTLHEWRDGGGERFASALDDAVQEISRLIGTALPDALNKLPNFR